MFGLNRDTGIFHKGSVYLTRDGKSLVQIDRDDKSPIIPFACSVVKGKPFHAGWYRKNGAWHEKESGHDLVSEWTKPIDEFQTDEESTPMRDPFMEALFSMHNRISAPMFKLSSATEQQASKESEQKEPDNYVSWDSVIGLEGAKHALQDAIESPHVHADIYKHFKLGQPKGVLMYGPPGCGKTMLGKAAASAMAKAHGKKTSDGFIYVKSADIPDRYVGGEVEKINKIFNQAKQFKQQNGYPAVIFIDEAEIMLPLRDRAMSWQQHMVAAFLTHMDGFDASNAFVILATNLPQNLDDAATRPGRIDRKIYVGRPARKDVEKILKSTLSQKTISKGNEINAIAASACSYFYKENKMVGEQELHQLVNGAMIAGIVEQAGNMAFRKALALKKEGAKFDLAEMGIGEVELIQAIDSIHREYIEIHNHAPTDMVQEVGKAAIKAIKRVSGEEEIDPDKLDGQ